MLDACLMVHGSWLKAHGQGGRGARRSAGPGPRPGGAGADPSERELSIRAPQRGRGFSSGQTREPQRGRAGSSGQLNSTASARLSGLERQISTARAANCERHSEAERVRACSSSALARPSGLELQVRAPQRGHASSMRVPLRSRIRL